MQNFGERQNTTLAVWSELLHPLVSDRVIAGIDTLRQPLSGPPTVFHQAAIHLAAVIIESNGEVAVLDPGLTYHVDRYLVPFLKSRGKEPSDVKLIINSHDHYDHVQANSALKVLCGAPVAAHENGTRTIPSGVDLPLHDGDKLSVGAFEFTVIHLPGHSDTAIGLYESRQKVLLTGDSLCGNGNCDQGIVILTDFTSYRQSIAKVASLAVQHLVPAHPYRGMSAPVLRGAAIHQYLTECREWLDRYETEAVRILAEAERPVSRVQLHEALVEALSYDPEELKFFYLKFLSGSSRLTVDALIAQKIPTELMAKIDDEGWVDQGHVYSSGE